MQNQTDAGLNQMDFLPHLGEKEYLIRKEGKAVQGSQLGGCFFFPIFIMSFQSRKVERTAY